MTLTKHALKYERCDLDQLRTFIKQRKVGDGTLESIKRQKESLASDQPPHLRLKHIAIKILCKADEDARFRFCDLPGELRNCVYENLLLFTDHRIKCFPQILATSKAINEEATSIFRETNPSCIIFGDEKPTCDPGMYFFGKTISKMTPRSESMHWRFLHSGACWPTELLLRDHLCFVIRQEGSGWATECLYSLFSFLRCNSTALKTVAFVCSGTSFLSKDWYKSSLVHKVHYDNMLYPIARFCAKFKVQFENCPASIPGAVQALVDKHSDLLKVDISVRGEIMGKLLAHDEILTTMLLHHLPDAHALYTDLKNDYHSALDSLDLVEVCERRMKEVMDKLDDFLNDRDMVALMRRGERIIGGYSQGLAEEFWKYDHARRQLSSGQDLPVGFIKQYKNHAERWAAWKRV